MNYLLTFLIAGIAARLKTTLGDAAAKTPPMLYIH